jgi:hypothetical protein
VAEAGGGGGAVPARCGLQVLEIADRARITELVVLEQRDPGGVVAPVLEALEAVEEELLALTEADVSDDPADG